MFSSRAPRFPVQFTAVYDDGERYLTAPVVNLSDSGLFIQTTAPVEAGTKVRIIPLLPPSRGLPELDAEVVRVQATRTEVGRALPAGMGLRFVGLSDADAEVLRAFCAGLRAGGGPLTTPTAGGEPLPKGETPKRSYQGLSLQKEKSSSSSSSSSLKKSALAPAETTGSKKAAPVDASSTAPTVLKPKTSEAKKAGKHDGKEPETSAKRDDDLPLLASGEAKLLDEPILLDRRKEESATDLEVSLSSVKSAELLSAGEEDEADDADETLLTRQASSSSGDGAAVDEASTSSVASAEDTPAESTEPVRHLRAQPPAPTPFTDTLPSPSVRERADAAWEMAGYDAAAALPPRNGVVIALLVLNLLALGGAVAYGAFRLDAVDGANGVQDARLMAMGQDLGFMSERQRQLQTTGDALAKSVAHVESLATERPRVVQTLNVEPAGWAGRVAVMSTASVANRGAADGKVVYMKRRVLHADTTGAPAGPGKAVTLNGPTEKGAVLWAVIDEEAFLSDEKELAAFSMGKKERKAFAASAKIGDVTGALEVGEERRQSKQLLVDLPAGGVVAVVTEVGLAFDDEKGVVLEDVKMVGVPPPAQVGGKR